MRSTIYLNHYPDAILRGDEAVTADLTMSIAEMGSTANRTGAFVSDILSGLGVQQLEAPQPSDMLLVGSREQIVMRQQRLTCDIGRIADKAMGIESPWNDPSLAKLEDWGYEIATDTIPSIAHDKSPFINSIGRILKVVGENLNHDGCDYERGLRPGWFHHAVERQTCFRDLGDTFTMLMARVPEYAKERKKHADRLELVHLYRIGEWLFDNATRYKETPEARFVEEFDLMVDLERRAIATVTDKLQRRGLPETFYLPPDIWQQLISDVR